MVSLARLYLLLGPSGKDYRENSNLFLLLCNGNQKQILDLVPLCSVFQFRQFCCRPSLAENEAFFYYDSSDEESNIHRTTPLLK